MGVLLACYCIFIATMQVAELSGRLQQADENNASLLSTLQPASTQSDAPSPASNSNLSRAESLQTDTQSPRRVHRRSNSTQSSEPQSEQKVQPSGKEASSHLQHAADSSHPLLSGQFCKSLQQIADSLTADAARLNKTAQHQAESGAESDPDRNGGKSFNWGFPISQNGQAGDKAGPVRPATAGPSDGSKQRPRRQWSAQNGMQSVDDNEDAANHQTTSRSFTAAGHVRQRAAGERARRRQQYDNEEYYASVPPTRMREEVLRQAREDYIREKNQVRDKRLQELTQNSTSAEVSQV